MPLVVRNPGVRATEDRHQPRVKCGSATDKTWENSLSGVNFGWAVYRNEYCGGRKTKLNKHGYMYVMH